MKDGGERIREELGWQGERVQRRDHDESGTRNELAPDVVALDDVAIEAPVYTGTFDGF